jgi:phosphoesterase RecJ-like protein
VLDTNQRAKIQKTLTSDGPFLVVSHRRPDGDAIGTSLALAAWLRGQGKEVAVWMPDPVPANYRFIRAVQHIVASLPPDLSDTVVVFVDSPGIDRAGDASALLGKARMIINIDHHTGNTRFGDLNLVDTSAAAAALILLELMEEAGIDPDPEVASLLYVGLLADTGGFRHGNTDARVLAAAGRLVERGADPAELSRNVFGEVAAGQIHLLGLVLSSLELELDGRVSLMFLTDEMRTRAGVSEETLEGLPTYGRMIRGVAVAVLLREEPGATRVNLRSKGVVDVNAIAATLGGGGHASASGATVDAPIDVARRIVLSAIRDAVESIRP